MLVVKPAVCFDDSSASVVQSLDRLKGSFHSIAVRNCRSLDSGGLVVKFPTWEVLNATDVAMTRIICRFDMLYAMTVVN